jgi:gliding motility-associated-like protein
MKLKSLIFKTLAFSMSFVSANALIAQTATVAHSWQEYDVLKAAGNEVVMDMSVYSTKKVLTKVWSAKELEEQETAKLLGGGSSDDCNCLKEIDKTYSIVPMDGYDAPEYRNDDASSPLIDLPFTFCLYGTNYTSCYINNNGNVSFGTPYGTFSSSGFPNSDFVMVAPFWADVDTRPAESGLPHYKITDHYMIVIWDRVGYFSQQTDKLNTFQLIISDGTDPIIPNGNNISFCYGDMEWTTGSASSGVNGFGGTPATVGVNEGDGASFMQAGRFDQAGSAYDGPTGANDGVSWLDNQIIPINSCDATSGNLIPIAPVLTLCDTIYVCAGNAIDLQFLGPEVDQSLTITYTIDNPDSGLEFNPVINVGASQLNINAPVGIPDGAYDIVVTATDNGTPAQSVTLYYTIVVIASAPPITIFGVPAICSGQSTSLSISPGYTNVAWSTGSAANLISVSQPGTYTVTGNLGGCDAEGSIVVETFDIVAPTISGEPMICPNDLTTLTIDNTYEEYDWSNNASTSTIDVGPGNYNVTVTDENGCTASDNIVINGYPAVSVGNDALICDDLLANLSGNDLAGAWTYTSQDGTVEFTDIQDTDTSVEVEDFGTYTFTFTESQCGTTDQMELTFLPSPNFTLTDTIGCMGGQIVLNPAGLFDSYFAWEWTNDESTNESLTYTVVDADSLFSWSATNACGTDQGSLHVFGEVCEIIIPNIFTPDGKGKNEGFTIFGLDNFPGSTILIYNRWGDLVYEKTNYYNQWKPAEDEAGDGVYFYILGVKRQSGMEYHEGTVTIIRGN